MLPCNVSVEETSDHYTSIQVGSRVIERYSVLVEEYMAGHEIGVHTWSHRVRIRIPRDASRSDLYTTALDKSFD